MRVFQKGLYVAALGMALSGCSLFGNSPVSDNESATDTATSHTVPEGRCSTDRLDALVGKPLTPDARQMIVDDSGATSYRMLRPDTVVTQEYDPDRLNITIDNELISRFSCG
ncbi:I78 family peptidase inhibitor [Larsenimonas rhizosphaerae]|uniref:I78 family peptidase inhibitor n=1 Tax=Larsenimonas rhizosphaerae TaxID=2944682 RepID=A0AA41ZMC9_9GAMM|nr:I78 family peptidase inhibitor [Larsenimonas rhizosphaerae]MCX2524503.1 I78 family peptidase inhibitor [Larsenimonas rhizosphaerae]